MKVTPSEEEERKRSTFIHLHSISVGQKQEEGEQSSQGHKPLLRRRRGYFCVTLLLLLALFSFDLSQYLQYCFCWTTGYCATFYCVVQAFFPKPAIQMFDTGALLLFKKGLISSIFKNIWYFCKILPSFFKSLTTTHISLAFPPSFSKIQSLVVWDPGIAILYYSADSWQKAANLARWSLPQNLLSSSSAAAIRFLWKRLWPAGALSKRDPDESFLSFPTTLYLLTKALNFVLEVLPLVDSCLCGLSLDFWSLFSDAMFQWSFKSETLTTADDEAMKSRARLWRALSRVSIILTLAN